MTYNKLLPTIFAIVVSMPLSLPAQSTPQTSEQSTPQTPAQTTSQTTAQKVPQSVAGMQKPRKKATSPAEPASDSQDLIPTFDLQFKTGDPIPGITASPAMVAPIQCNGDGTALLDMLMPPEFMDRALYLVSATKGSAISLKNIPELSNVQYVGAFASHSTVGALFYGTKKVEDANKEEAYHNFIAVFDSDNGYQKTIELPLSYVVKRFGLLPSGEILVFGFNTAGNDPRLSLLDSSGEIKRTIQLPEEIQDAIRTVKSDEKEENMPYPAADNAKGSKAYGFAQFTLYGEKIIFWEPGEKSVLEIGNGGSAQEVEIESPKGYILGGFIASNDRLIVQFKRIGLPESSAIDVRPEAQNIVFYEVDASDGTLRRKLHFGNDQIGWTACERDGELLSFKTDDKQRLIPMTADLGR